MGKRQDIERLARRSLHLHVSKLICNSRWRAAYLEDASAILQAIPSNSIDAIITSPPYALHFKKEYGNVARLPDFLMRSSPKDELF